MNIDRAVEKAEGVRTSRQAAELYNDIDYELSVTDNEDAYDHGEQALSILRDRFPGVEQAARQITAPPAGATKHMSAGEPSAPVEARPRSSSSSRPQTAGARVRRATTIHARPRSSRAPLTPGTRRAASSVGQLGIRAVEVVVGLTLLGLLLSPRGSSAIAAGEGLLGKLLGRIASPTSDPLAGIGKGAGGSSGPSDIPIIPPFERKPPGPGGKRPGVLNPSGYHLKPIPVLPPVSLPRVGGNVPVTSASPWDIFNPSSPEFLDPAEAFAAG